MNWFQRNFKTIIYISFLVPILTVAFVSISHVTKWYGISNPFSWAIYLSVGIEIAALSALAAISAKMGRKVYFPFGIVTLIQFIGNIFFCFNETDVLSKEFKSWVELTSPIFEGLGSDITDVVAQKRWLALLEGGLLPIISLASLHFFIKYGGVDDEKISTPVIEEVTTQAEEISTPVEELTTPVEELTTPAEEEVVEPIKEVDDSVKKTSVLNALKINMTKKINGTDKWG